MKKGLLITALLATAPWCAQAQEAVSTDGLYTGPVIQLRAGFGGDEVGTVFFADGDSERMRTGNGIEGALGWHVKTHRGSPWDLRALLGYKYDSSTATNADITFTRMTWQLIPTYEIGKGFSVGAGPVMHTGIKFKADGFASDTKFKNAIGADIQVGWRGLALTYTVMDYKAKGGRKVSADHLGLQYTYSFGWTCCRSGGAGASSAETPVNVVPLADETAQAVPGEASEVAVTEASTEAAAAPVAAPSVASTTRSTAILPNAATLRDQPKTSATGAIVAPAKTRVRLENSLKNAEGTWWFVTADGIGGGWVQESETSDRQN